MIRRYLKLVYVPFKLGRRLTGGIPRWIGIEIEGAEPPSDFFLESYGLVPLDEMSDVELTRRGVNEWIRVSSLERPFDRQSILRAIFG